MKFVVTEFDCVTNGETVNGKSTQGCLYRYSTDSETLSDYLLVQNLSLHTSLSVQCTNKGQVRTDNETPTPLYQ